MHTHLLARKDSAGVTISAVCRGLVTQLLRLMRAHMDLILFAQTSCVFSIYSCQDTAAFAVALSVPRAASGVTHSGARSKTEIYGLSSNDASRQKQADDGTLLATRSSSLVGEIILAQRRRKVPEAGSLENPPGTEGGPDGPMWLLPEVLAFMKDLNTQNASFNTCAHQKGPRTK